MDKLVQIIEKLVLDGYTDFISGGAQGFDQLAFWAVNIVKKKYPDIRNIVYVPFKGQERIWLATGLFSQAEYNLMLELADEVVYLAEVDVNDYKQITKALYGRNHAMCDASNAILGLYKDTGFRTEKKSGTAECLRYAESVNLPIMLLDKDTFAITEINDSKQPMMFRGKYDFLSNMHLAPVKYNDRVYLCSETAYQVAKLKHDADKNMIYGMNGYESKDIVRKQKLEVRDDWFNVNTKIMYDIVHAKFTQNPELAQKLLATGDMYLVENNYWKDTFWGVCNGVGENNLGKILMEVRDELRRM